MNDILGKIIYKQPEVNIVICYEDEAKTDSVVKVSKKKVINALADYLESSINEIKVARKAAHQNLKYL